jgi:putative transposase
MEGVGMSRKHHKPEEIVAKLRQVEVLTAQGKAVGEAVRAIGVTEPTYYRWRSEYGGLKLDQVKRLKRLEQENGRLREAVAVSDAGEAGAEGGRLGKCMVRPSPARAELVITTAVASMYPASRE